MRIIISRQTENYLLDLIAGTLESACDRHPSHFQRIKDQPDVIDHYAYSDNTRGTVVLSADTEPMATIIIHPGRHVVFDEILALITEYYQV